MRLSGKELLSEAFPIIENFAPTIAGAIGGPIGMAIGYALPLLSKAFNTNENNLTQLVESIKTSPDSQTKLQKLEEDFSQILTSMGNDSNLVNLEVSLKMQWASPGASNT